MLPISPSVTRVPILPRVNDFCHVQLIFQCVTQFATCHPYFNLILIFCKCGALFQVWRIFSNMVHHSKCGAFFQVWCIIPSVAHFYKCIWRETNWCFLIGWFEFRRSDLSQMRTHGATRLLALILSLRYVARIQTSLNSCDRSQRQNSVAATMIFTCHTRRFVAATCRGDVSHRVSRPLVDILS